MTGRIGARGRSMGFCISLGFWAAAASPAVCFAGSGQTFTSTSPTFGWRWTPVNTADLPGRCPAGQLPMSGDLPGRSWAKVDSLGAQIDGMLTHEDVRRSPMPILYFAKTSDYYSNRAAVQHAIERRLARLKSAQRPTALGNYAMTLLYLGEFQKVVDFFDPRSTAARAYADNGEVRYALAHAYFRLGRHQESLGHAERAHELLEDAVLDTRWQVVLSALGAHGKDFYKVKSPIYSTEHILKYFPSTRWELPFEDVTDELGIDRWGGFGSASFVDLDGNGFDDLILERKFFPLAVYKNAKGKSFEAYSAERMGFADACNAMFVYPGDFDNDGRPDLYRNCCNWDGRGPVSLLKNLGGLAFEDVTKKSGLPEGVNGGTAACWGDYDLDGNLDLVVNAFDSERPVRLYRNNGNGAFRDVTAEAGLSQIPKGDGLGCAFGDFSGGRYPDLFIQGGGWRRFYRNRGDGAFEDATLKSGIGPSPANRNGYMSLAFDYDNDGKLDLLAESYAVASGLPWKRGPVCLCSNLLTSQGYSEDEWRNATTIFRNNGDGTFTDEWRQTQFLPLGAMGIAHGDWNNDGAQSIVMGTGGLNFQQLEPFLFYQNNGNGTFTNKTPFTMLSLWGKGHGIAFGDYDHDGRLDLILNNGAGMPGDLWPSYLLHNTGNENHWIQISLKAGNGTNRSAIGAGVRVFAGSLKQLQTVASGGSMGVSSLSLHFGLGQRKRIDKIVVEWPNPKKNITELRGVSADQAIEISEADGSYRRLWVPAKKGAL